MSTAVYPVHVHGHLDPRLSRWQWLVKWLLAIPHYVVLAFLWVAFVVVSMLAFVAILATGRYPRGMFDFNVGVLRWSWRVAYYAYGALGTDRYPPFSLADDPTYPARLDVDYPEHLSRGLVLVKWWLLALPHYLVISLFLGGAGYAIGADGDETVGSPGLIGVLVLVAAVVLLFTGRYPRPVFDLLLGLNRWVLRVAAYAALMTDDYPPFRLDQGDDDPGVLLAAEPSRAVPVGSAAPAPGASGTPVGGHVPRPQGDLPGPPPGPPPVPPPGPPAAPPTGGGARPWTAGRIVALVLGSLVLLGSLGLGIGAVGVAVVDQGLRDDDGYLMSGDVDLTTATYAIASEEVTIHSDADAVPQRMLGEVKLEARGEGRPVFVGIAASDDVARYLGSVEHATLTDMDPDPSYETEGTDAPATPPTQSDIWVAQSSGPGTQELVWEVDDGDWTVVVMNADGSRGVAVEISAGATLPALGWLVPLLAVMAGAGLVVAILLLVLALRSGSGRS